MYAPTRPIYQQGSARSFSVSSRWDEEVKIEHKLFLLRFGSGGKSICLTERSRNASYLLEADFDSAQWIRLKIWDYINNPGNCSVFNRYRGTNAAFIIQRFSNKRGCFLEISKIFQQGRKQLIIVPSGRNLWGWKCLEHLMSKMLRGNKQWPMKRGLEKGRVLPAMRANQRVNPSQGMTNAGKVLAKDNDFQCDEKIWDAAIIITKGHVNTPWDLVRDVFGKAVKRRIEITPFQANKAVWWPQNVEEASYYLNMKRCFLEKRVTLSFEKWEPDINKKEMAFECCNSWIRIYGIPWNLWSTDTFKSIGNFCGGLLDISTDTSRLKDLSAAKIKVRGPEGGFINSVMQIPLEGGTLFIRIEVDSVDIAAYESFERQSYAQVVVNGVKMRAGWGNSNVRKIINGNDELSVGLCTKKEEWQIGADKEQRSKQPDYVGNDGFGGLEKKSSELSQKEGSKVEVKDSASKVFLSEPLQGGKQIKILKRIIPKEAADFRSLSIQSLNVEEIEEAVSKSLKEGKGKPVEKFEKTYCRRKYLTNDNKIGNPFESLDDKTLLLEDIEVADLEERIINEVEEDLSEDGSEFFVPDSPLSVNSEGSAQFEEVVEDIKGLFASKPAKSQSGGPVAAFGAFVNPTTTVSLALTANDSALVDLKTKAEKEPNFICSSGKHSAVAAFAAANSGSGASGLDTSASYSSAHDLQRSPFPGANKFLVSGVETVSQSTSTQSVSSVFVPSSNMNSSISFGTSSFNSQFAQHQTFSFNSSASSPDSVAVASSSEPAKSLFRLGESSVMTSVSNTTSSFSSDASGIFKFGASSSAPSSVPNTASSFSSGASDIFKLGAPSSAPSSASNFLSSNTTPSNVFGSTSPFMGFSFVASSATFAPTSANSAVFNSTTSSSSPIFSFGAASPAMSSSPPNITQPMFGNGPSSSAASPGNGDQMNTDDSMAEDPVQYSTPSIPVFGQPAVSPSPSGFMFGSTAASSVNPFSFGGQQNLVTSQNPSLFQGSGGSFSLGSGGGDKSTRKFIKVNRNKNRKK